MKCFFITTLLCVTSLNACLTKEEVEKKGYKENWRPRETNLILYRESNKQIQQITIDAHHIPVNSILPQNIPLYFPRPSKDFLANKSDIYFETDGNFVAGSYCGPEEDSERTLWSLVKDSKGTMFTVPTALLMILLTKQQLEEAQYQENWKERSDDVTIDCINGQVTIDRHHVPAYGSFTPKTEVYFPLPTRNFMLDKSAINFETDGTYLRGYYCAPETNSSRVYWSNVEDESGIRFTLPTARIMLAKTLLKAIESRRKSTI